MRISTKSEYYLMPPLFHLDPYDSCIHRPGGVYCSVDIDLVSDEPSELYSYIQEYSADTKVHFNHTQLKYGICLTQTCREFYKENTSGDLNIVLEACLNNTLWRDYKLKARVSNNVTCNKLDESIQFDTSDIILGVVIAILLILNLIGSFVAFHNDAKVKYKGFFACFSISHNWQKLVAPAGAGPEPRLTRLKGFCGFRAVTMALVIMTHSMMPFVKDIDNPIYVEQNYKNPLFLMFLNGTLVVQTFFVMSGFLLAYNLQIYKETHRVSWSLLPQSALNRWLRLIPVYALVLGLTATWLRHAGHGPLWESTAGTESADCRSNWYLNLLLVSNYFDHTHCMVQTWYVAADYQLHLLGLAVCITRGRARRALLVLLLIVGVLAPAVHTYFQDLDAVVMLSPERVRYLFQADPTFNHAYKRGHTNIASFVIGMVVGLAIYRWQKTDYKFPRILKQQYIYWAIFPAGVALLMLGSIFYLDGPRLSIYLRTPFAALARPLFGGLIGFYIIALVFKFENVYRRILEWRGWAVPSRLTYSAYILHMSIINLINSSRTTLVHATLFLVFEILVSNIIISFVLALPLHLLVEAPLVQVVKLVLSGPRKTPPIDKLKINQENLVKNEFTAV
ncbi:O-acyltransferase like protein-like [Pectinophora gossypiella]|uniref:O-acyltransferase like protein-like n=1 Tax=Pectinophora gossypiella TaxID=13191 RepID=UPI00214E4B74|nr:O-acyltransferase like protein-like [Pectinophora gossypiella]